jgi:hypothetical protein
MIYEKFDRLTDEKHGRMIKSLIGISRAQFDTLCKAFSQAYEAIQLESLQQGEIKQIPSGGLKGSLSTVERKVFFTLYYLKTYPTFDVLGFHFGFSSGHAHDHLENLLPVLLRSLSDLGVLPIRTPGSPKEFAQLIEQYRDIAIDGVECACVRPQDKDLQEARFSGKKTPYAQGAHPVDPKPPNPLGVQLCRRKCPRFRTDETGIRPQIQMVSQGQCLARS